MDGGWVFRWGELPRSPSWRGEKQDAAPVHGPPRPLPGTAAFEQGTELRTGLEQAVYELGEFAGHAGAGDYLLQASCFR